MSTQRPSIAIYVRDDPRWQELAEENEVYGFGYGCGQADIAAGLPAMSDAELASTWHRDYTEGYLET